MLENRWSREYLKGFFQSSGKTTDDLQDIVSTAALDDIEDPLLEIEFLRQGGSAIKCFNLVC